MRTLFWVLGAINVAHGLWMLFAPASWYHGLPAAVPDTGPLNTHFVRDIGAAFITIGVAFLGAAPQAERRRDVVVVVTVFFVLHAVIHVADLLAGNVHAGHWLIDLPGVFLPAILLVVLCLPRWWQKGS